MPQLASRLVEASSYAERLFTYHEVGELSPEAASVPAEREGVAYEPDALTYLLERTGHYPFFIQTYGKYAWQIAPTSTIAMTAARSADSIAQRGLTDFTAPLVGDYVRRHHPLSDLLTTA